MLGAVASGRNDRLQNLVGRTMDASHVMDAPEPAVSSGIREQLLLEEYRSLRAQLDYQIAAGRDLERNVVIGVTAVFAWVAAIEKASWLVVPAWLLAPLIAFLGWQRARSLTGRVDQIANYLASVEARVAAPTQLSPSWETTVAAGRVGAKSPGLGKSQRLFWRTVIAFSSVGALYGFIWQVVNRQS